jgi:hypothetical protein
VNVKFFVVFMLSLSFSNLVFSEVDLNDAKNQVLNLLDVITERNAALKSAYPDAIKEHNDGTPGAGKDKTKPQNHPVAAANVTDNVAANDAVFLNGLRDPFAMTRELRKAGTKDDDNNDQAYSDYKFKSPSLSVKLPRLTLKGVVFQQGSDQPLALLEVANQGVYVVRLNDEIGFNPSDPGQVIKIKKISNLNIIVEVGTLGDLIIVR